MVAEGGDVLDDLTVGDRGGLAARKCDGPWLGGDPPRLTVLEVTGAVEVQRAVVLVTVGGLRVHMLVESLLKLGHLEHPVLLEVVVLEDHVRLLRRGHSRPGDHTHTG